MAILSVLSAAVLFAMFGVVENAKEARTKAQIAKMHELISTKWESYRTRAISMVVTKTSAATVGPRTAPAIVRAELRLLAVRDLMRMELPDRITDLNDDPITFDPSNPISVSYTAPNSLWSGTWKVVWTEPSVYRMYRRRASNATSSSPPWRDIGGDSLPFTNDDIDTGPNHWSIPHQGAECLYLILSGIRDGDKSGLDFFKENEIGDVDGDGMLEILDAWGNPIEFLRWAPGFSIGVGLDGQWGVAGTDDDSDSTTDNIEERGWSGSDDERVSDLNIPDQVGSPDPFDPVRVDDNLRSLASVPIRITFSQYPLIYSSGRDGVYDITSDADGILRYTQTPLPVDPFYVIPPPSGSGEPEKQIGMPWDAATPPDGLNHIDNITNHLLDADL
jgi:type II secretory pathway pseudopilin PulG